MRAIAVSTAAVSTAAVSATVCAAPRRRLHTLALAIGLLMGTWGIALPTPARAAEPAAAGASAPTSGSSDTAQQTQAAVALYERVWEWSGRNIPEFATYRGDHRYGDRLTDASPQAVAQRDKDTAAFLAEARAIRRDALSPTDRVSLDMFIQGQERFVQMAQFPAARGMSLRALGGPQTQLVEVLQFMPVARAEQVEQMLARMAAYPRRMEQEIASLRASAAAGWVPARDVLERVLPQIDAQLPANLDDSPLFAPFKKLGTDIPAAQRQALQVRGREAVQAQLAPALRRLRSFITDELLPRAPADGSLGRYPDGERVYAMAVRNQTTTNMTPAQIHAIGQRELTRLHGEMQAVMREVGFQGTFAQFIQYLETDERFFHKSPEALLAGYRDIAKRIDIELPKLFAELPRAPYGVVGMPPHMGANRAEYYNGPALDGTRAGQFFANTVAFKKRPIWGMETLVAHEAVPGHHLQVARATELRNLPQFRRGGFGYTAFSEGWALYAETLGFQLGLYTDPYSRLGHLQWQAFRAARLVADTGIHAMGWSRQQAIDMMVERTGVEREFVTGEVDRYTSEPGQALAYMIGKLKFDELRDRAKQKLGARFDIRRFHNACIDQGALPLATLDTLIDEWIAAEAARP